PLHYGIRFVALSAGEADLHGMDDYVERMSTREKKNTLLVIDLNSLITGDHLYFNSGMNTPRAVRKQTSERALLLARQQGIERVFWPSSIAAFGPTTPAVDTPQKTVME
ncbi:hypothetical protein AB4142_29440, partial [Variovorax sp. 2RAF20]